MAVELEQKIVLAMSKSTAPKGFFFVLMMVLL